ncbi:MAG: PAS domain-containing protein [Proteobacteria bacterium]|nr:PAS domain-containing protein [Pseudomonadota bacterium]
MSNRINTTEWIQNNLFSEIPMATAVIDRNFNLVQANKAFEQMFGEWHGKKCYRVYKNRDSMCHLCKGAAAFEDGKRRVNEEVGYDISGRLTRYIKHTIPIVDQDGSIPFLIEMATDITEAEQIKQEYQILFEQVPCNLFIISKDYRIVRANKRAKEMFGDVEGKFCFSALKARETKCPDCTANRTFDDGRIHSGHSTVKNKDGKEVQLHVTAVPYDVEDGKFELILEMAVDITQILELKDELKVSDKLMQSVISGSLDGIIVTDNKGAASIINKAASKILEIDDPIGLKESDLTSLFPDDFLEQVAKHFGPIYLLETMVKTMKDNSVPVRLVGFNLKLEENFIGKAFWIQDLQEIKNLEDEKLEAERLATVGQTVAGLAHGIKNVLTGVEGGIYLLNLGLKKGHAEQLKTGVEMLNRNTKRVSIFVKEFLNFSKGQEINARLCDPNEIMKDVESMYSVRIKQLDIDLAGEYQDNMGMVPLDGEKIHESLSNLLGNAIDAIGISESKEKGRIVLRTIEKDDMVIFEISDNGIGMDYEVKKKVFTNFFTTKGLGGTGLGLLVTKKNIQQHGGIIEFDTELEVGSTFRIVLPKNRLPRVNELLQHKTQSIKTAKK